MIERYFEAGRRFRWTLPKQVNKKSEFSKQVPIIDTPEPIDGYMICSGRDERLKTTPTIKAQDPRIGIRIRYQWLAYAPLFTTKLSPAPERDVLTGPMSGCIIPVWKEYGDRYVGHVGTVDTKKLNPKVKEYFANTMDKHTIGFNPAKVWKNSAVGIVAKLKKNKGASVVALINSSNECFSLLMVKVSDTHWVCGGKKEVPQIGYKNLYKKFVPREKSVKDLRKKFESNGKLFKFKK